MKKFHSIIFLPFLCTFLITAILLITPHPVSAAVLKGVQSGTVNLATNSASVTVNISGVDTSRAFLVFSTTLDSSDPDHSHISGQITNGTTLTFQRSASGAPAVAAIRWYVAEFSSGVTVQRGSRAITALNHDIPISPVDTSKSFPLVSARVPGTTYSNNDFFQAKITSSTNLRLSQGLSAGGGTVEWQVVEFTGASVQSGDVSFTTAQPSRTADVSPVDTAKSWLIYSYQSGDAVAPSNQNDIGQKLVRGWVTNNTTLTFDRNNVNSTIDLTWYLVSFTDGTRVQHNTQAFTNAETQKDVTISSVDMNKSLASGGMFMRGGRSNYTSAGSNTDNPGVGWAIHDLTSATNLRITRATTGAPVATASTADFGWFVTTFSTCSAAGTGTYIEAENFTGTINQGKGTFYVDSSQPGFNGTGYLRVSAEGPGQALPPAQEGKRYRVHFPEAGTYRVWLRMYAQGPSSDSVHIGLNDTRVGAVTPSGYYNQWRWESGLQEGTNQITIPSAGEHTINLWIRETDMLIDALYITKGTETPSGGIPSGAVVIDPTLCTTPHPNTISGKVFEDADFAGTASDFGAGDHPLANVEVELYDNANNFIASRTTASDGTYTFWNIPSGTYKVRARTASIGDSNTPPRGGFNSTCSITDPATGSPCATAILTWANGAAKYGGHDPALDDTTTARNAGPGNSFTTLTVSGSGAANVNFGFAYNLIVNTNDSGPGSLRQFILNTNAIGSADGTTANTSQFRIPNGALTSGKATINLGSTLTVTDSGTVIDGRTQITNIGDTNGGRPVVVLRGGDFIGVKIQNSGGEIRKLEITNFTQVDTSAVYFETSGGAGLFSDNVVHGNYAGLTFSVNGNTASNNTIYNNQAQGIYVISSNNLIEDNTFYNNAITTSGAVQINLGGSNNIIRRNLLKNEARHGIIISEGSNGNKIFQNTVYNCGTVGGGSWDGIQVWSSGNIVKNNIAANNSRFGIGHDFTDAVIDYNLMYGNGQQGCYGPCLPNSANITADPQFTNAGAGDFTLQATSPAINRGIDLGADQPDMNGAAAGLYNGPQPDMGAFESGVVNTCVVTTTSDSNTAAAGSLRYCMNHAKTNPGTTISFSIGYNANQSAGGDSWHRISPESALPSITAAGTVIDCTTQATHYGNTNSRGPEIEIHGSNTLNFGLEITGGSNNMVRGLVINSFTAAGIAVGGATVTQLGIYGNYVGTNATGSAALANKDGIYFWNAPQNNIDIGGAAPGQGNLISGNTDNGIWIVGGSNYRIYGNYVGTDRAAAAKIPNNRVGIKFGTTSLVHIGGPSAGQGNIISGNGTGATEGRGGISIDDGTTDVYIRGNIIGSGPTGTESLGNADWGIQVFFANAASNLHIGGLGSNEGNLIAYNANQGIFSRGAPSNLNMEGNTIRNNGGPGIHNQSAGVDIVGNLIRNNGNSSDGILLTTTAANARIYHNTIHGSGGDGVEVQAAGAILRNNIITGNSGYGINASVTVTENYNLVTDASTAPANALGRANFTLSPTDMNLNPQFVNAAAGDFRLTECSSPAVNTGAHLGADQPDMNGAALGLFNGPAPDRGALESTCTTSPSDIVIDGNFADWCNGVGNDLCFDDAGGQDDWTNPARLDITRFGIGSNLSDTLFVLMGFDDTSFNAGSSTACVLIDTTMDDNINAVLCSTLGSGGVQAVELFTCDNSISGGCSSASLAKTYTTANYRFSSSVAGPWNADSMIEIGIPFTDLPGYPGSSVILTTLMSYASSSLLKSPKDSIFGTGGRENYKDRVLYNIGTGTGGQIGEAGNFVISGLVYADEGVTILGSGRSVRLLVNGIDRGANTTDAAGGYFFSLPLDAGNAVLLYLDNAAEKANTATVASTGHLDGVDLYAGHLIVRREGGGNITNTNLATAKGASTDTDILYSVTSGNLNVSGATLHLPSGHGFSPGGNVTTPAMKSLGNLNGGNGTFDLNGDLTISGGNFTATSGTTFISGALTFSSSTFAHNTGTFTFDSGNTTTISSGSMVFNDVQFNTNQNATLNVTDTMHVSGNLLFTRLAAIGEGTIAVAGDVTTTTDTVKGTGVILFTGSGDQILRVDDAGGTGALPAVHIDKDGGSLLIRDRIRIWGEKGWKWTAGTVDSGTSTIEFRDTSKTIDPGEMKFNDVAINMGTYSLSVTGTMQVAGNLTISNIGMINGGNIAVEGDVTTTDTTVAGSAVILFTGSRDQSLRVNGEGGSGAIPNVRIDKDGGTLFLMDTIIPYGSSGWTYVAGNVDPGTSTVDFQYGGKTIDSGAMFFHNLAIRIGNGYTLSISGMVNVRNDLSIISVANVTGGAILVGGNLMTTDTTVGGTATITLNGDGPQTITAAGGADLPNSTLTINKPSGTATLASALAPTGALNLTVAQGTLDLAGYNLTGVSTLALNNDAMLRLQGDETVTATNRAFNPGSTVLYYGDGSYPTLAAGNSYSDLVFANAAGSWTQTAPLTARDLTITAGTLNSDGRNINLSGNWSNSGTFIHGNNTVTLNGTNQSISGNNTFHHLFKTVASADTLTFEAGSTTTVNGALTLKGTSGQLLGLASSSPGTHWNLNLTAGATKDISHVNVSWSDASGSDPSRVPVNPYYYTDGGDTVAWFGTPNLLVIKSASTPNANPGAEVAYTLQVNNSGNAPAMSVVLDGQLSPFLAWSLHAFGENTPFQLTLGDPPSGLSLGTPVYSNDGGATWTYVPTSGGGGAPAGFDGNVTNWKLPLTGEIPAGAGSTLRYKGRVK